METVQTDITQNMRGILVDWLVEVSIASLSLFLILSFFLSLYFCYLQVLPNFLNFTERIPRKIESSNEISSRRSTIKMVDPKFLISGIGGIQVSTRHSLPNCIFRRLVSLPKLHRETKASTVGYHLHVNCFVSFSDLEHIVDVLHPKV